TTSYHIILRKNDDEFNDYQCPHQQRRASSSSSHHHKGHRRLYGPKFDLVRISTANKTRSKRSMDVVSSDLNFLDGDIAGSSNNKESTKLQKPTAPIQLDDINSNDVYDDTSLRK